MALAEGDQPAQADTGAPRQSAASNQEPASTPFYTVWPKPPQAVEPKVYQPDCAKPQEHDDADFCEQRRMAEAATDQLDWIIFQAIVGALTVVGLLATVILNFKSTEAAIAAATAANASVQVSIETAKLELRARLAAIPAGIDRLVGREDVIGLVDIRNAGHLPARNVFVSVHMKAAESKEAHFPVLADNPAIHRAIQPGAEMRQGSEEDPELGAIIASGAKYLFVWGVAYYDDGYGERRFTRFCHRYPLETANPEQLELLPTGEPIVVIDATNARYHQTGNDAN